ncbi:MAG: DUF1501 domain-containing protein, partial [Verrucomicrobiae bacterium]|nr:DUF1501 domain-containing protein [Verrucomicrobiae bacterium]
MKTFSKNELTRRHFMATAAGSFLGVGLMSGFAGRAVDLVDDENPGYPMRKKPAERLIYLYMGGGMTHLDTFDTKPGHANQGPVREMKTNVPGIRLSEYLPQLTNHADKMAIINGMTSTAGAHEQARYLMHTSYEQRATIRHPGIGAYMLKYRDRLNKDLPGSVFIGGNSRIEGGAGFFESSYEPLAINNPADGLKNIRAKFNPTDFRNNLDLAGDLDREFRKQFNLKATRAYSSMYEDAVRLMESEDLKAFDIRDEKASVKEAYGSDPFGQGCLLARRLIEHDVRAVEVSYGGWDTHQNNFISVPERTAVLDQALSALLSDLERTGLLESTLVVLSTEFGRTPRINQNAGRDHYPKAFSTMIAGGGVTGGVRWGKT